METKFTLNSNYLQFVMDEFDDELLFDHPSSATKEETAKIITVFQKFLDKTNPEIQNLRFSEKIKSNLINIQQLYQPENCNLYNINIQEKEFPEFCKFIDRCISNKIDFLMKKKSNKRKIFFSEELRHESKNYVVGIVPQESLERGYTPDWLDTYSFTSEEEVRDIFEKWDLVNILTTFVGRFSFPKLMGLKPSDRKFILENGDDVIELFKQDEELTCAHLMDANKEIRNFIVNAAKEFCRAIVNAKDFSIKDLFPCSQKQLTLILTYKHQLDAIIIFYEAPFKELLKLDEQKLEGLLEQVHSESSRRFLNQFADPLKVMELTEEEFKLLSEDNQNEVKINCLQLAQILAIFEVEPPFLFLEENKIDVASAIENIWKIKSLLEFKDLIPSYKFSLMVNQAIAVINECEWDEIEIIESFSEELRWNILQDYKIFDRKIKEKNMMLEDLKDISLEDLELLGLFDHVDQDVIREVDSDI